jgi:hypothetical protein
VSLSTHVSGIQHGKYTFLGWNTLKSRYMRTGPQISAAAVTKWTCWQRQRQLERMAVWIVASLAAPGAKQVREARYEHRLRFSTEAVPLWKLTMLLVRLYHSSWHAGSRESTYLRELFYRLVPVFDSQQELTQYLDRLLAAARISRFSLGIIAESRGWVFFGSGIQLQKRSIENERPRYVQSEAANARLCTPHRGLMPIPDDIVLDPGAYQLVVEPRQDLVVVILIVEKFGVFRCLVDEGFASILPVLTILVTGGGQPSLATRALVAQIARCLEAHHAAFRSTNAPHTYPRFDIYVITDYDPYGLCIARQYRRSLAAALPQFTADSKFTRLPRWIGPRACHLFRARSSRANCELLRAKSEADQSPLMRGPMPSQRALVLARNIFAEAVLQGDSLVAEELHHMIGSQLYTDPSMLKLARNLPWIDGCPGAAGDGIGTHDLHTLVLLLGPGGFARDFLPRLILETRQEELRKSLGL